MLRRLVSLEGRFAVVTNVEAGCGGRDVAQWALVLADERHGADGQVAWSWHPDADAKLAVMIRWWRGQESPVPGESAKQPLKPSRGEGRVVPAVPVVPAACIFFAGGPQASAEAWPSLRPLSEEGDRFW